MISVLIPIYNFNIRQLVDDLYQQLTVAGMPFEILCFDDGSEESFKRNNQLINNLHINYYELPENIGRARVRNVLAKAAQYPYLLFMDCDSKVISPHYIQNYIDYLQKDTVLYGGRSYASTPPDRSELYFHWYYGRQREQIPAIIRQQNPYHAFMTNNFLISKEIFDKIQFDERLTQYGHEDTLFGLELQKRQIKILHLDNPLEHLGLEETTVFFNKTRQGIQNLAFLAKEHPQLETRLLKTYHKLEKTGLLNLTYQILKTLQPFILRKLQSQNFDLRWFDLYKLKLLIEIVRT